MKMSTQKLLKRTVCHNATMKYSVELCEILKT